MNRSLYKEYEELQVLNALANNKTQKSISEDIAISLGKVNYIAQALIKKGFIKVGNFVNAESKTNYKYLLTEKGLEEKIHITKKFIKIKKMEYEQMQEEIDMRKIVATKKR